MCYVRVFVVTYLRLNIIGVISLEEYELIMFVLFREEWLFIGGGW